VASAPKPRTGSSDSNNKSNVISAMASGTPRYHGRHGFTPPSHAPARGQQ
jgi:hypothetical protein